MVLCRGTHKNTKPPKTQLVVCAVSPRLQRQRGGWGAATHRRMFCVDFSECFRSVLGTSVNPCISIKSDVQQSEVSESIDSLNSFLECDYECHFEHGFAPSCLRYSAASRLYVLAGERIQIRSQPRHNIDQNIPEKSIPKSIKNRSKIDENRFLEPCWLKMTPPWSHLGPR